VKTNIYWLWLLSMGSLIFLMQAGFFLLEGGQVRSRDVGNVMMKMTGIWCLCSLLLSVATSAGIIRDRNRPRICALGFLGGLRGGRVRHWLARQRG
jgi:ammonia channel protein AmtB